MADQQLLRLRNELDDKLKSHFWGRQIQAASQCIILMAECKLLVSKPSAMTLDLSGYGLKYQTLYGNIGHCTQMGEDTFRLTAERMARVGWLANEMSRPGGIIESMMKYLDPKQSTLRDKQLHSYVVSVLETIDESVSIICEVRQDFDDWEKVTANLLRALEDKASSNRMEHMDSERALRDQSLEKKRLEESLEGERESLAKLEKQLEGAFKVYETFVNNLPTSTNSATSVLAAAAIAGLTPEILVLATACGCINFAALYISRWNLNSRIQKLEKETGTLSGKLEQLSGEAQSIAEVASIVEKALQGLNQLQEQINDFLEFLAQIQSFMKIVSSGKPTFVNIKNYTIKEREELVLDREMKEELQSNVLLMKTRFLIASKATSLYNEVSDRFVIPGVRWVSGLRLVGSADDVFTDKVKEIEERGSRICAETMHLICKRVDELGVEIEVLNRNSIESFAKVAPEIVQKMMGEAKEVEEEVVQS